MASLGYNGLRQTFITTDTDSMDAIYSIKEGQQYAKRRDLVCNVEVNYKKYRCKQLHCDSYKENHVLIVQM